MWWVGHGNLSGDFFALTGPLTLRYQAKRLFDAPLSEKEACTIQQNNRGVSDLHSEARVDNLSNTSPQWSAMNYETLDPANQRVSPTPSSLLPSFN